MSRACGRCSSPLRLCHEAGLVRLGLVALDGTKVGADAALDANRAASSIDEQVARMLAEAEAADAQKDGRCGTQGGGELPAALARRADRLARLRQCQDKLRRQAAEAASRQQEKIDIRALAKQASGKRKRGRKPKPADAAVDPGTVANVSDPESGIMKTGTVQELGGWRRERYDHPGRGWLGECAWGWCFS